MMRNTMKLRIRQQQEQEKLDHVTCMTDEKYNDVVYIIQNWDNPEIRRQHRIGYSLVKKYTVRSKKDVEGNLIKSLYVIKRDSVKEGDNVRRKLLL
jgi:hypothetical protein